MTMGTDMHVAIEIKRNEYDYGKKGVVPKWNFVKAWTVDRCYDLFGCFGRYRRSWSNAITTQCAEADMSSYLKREKRDGCYGFHIVTPELLKMKVIGWTPKMSKEELEEYEPDGPPVIDKDWFFDGSVYKGDDTYYTDYLNYAIYRLMLRRYGKGCVRLVVYFDS